MLKHSFTRWKDSPVCYRVVCMHPRSICSLTRRFSGQGADDIASVISNFLEGLGSAAGLGMSPECDEAVAPSASEHSSDFDQFDSMGRPFTTPGEDSMFVDSLFQVDEEL